MKTKNNIVVTGFLMIALFSCSKKPKDFPPYSISKVFKTDSVTTVNARINSRLTYMQLVAIAGKIKADSVKIQNMEVHYLLPGNADFSSGDNSYYASAKFLKEGQVKAADTTQDYNGNAVRMKIFGLSQDRVQKLLAMQPKEITGQNVLGKYIDDYNHTVIIPFQNVLDEKHNLYVIELDSTAKVVSATVPQKVLEDGVEKWLVSKNGDYITIKDSILSQFSSEGLGLPYNSIKTGR